MKNVVIIGGGASGLVCAIKAKKNNNNVTIIERNDKCAKKILISGNGRCNYFNKDMSLKHFHTNSKNILNKIINENNTKKLLNFFEEIGIKPNIKNGYYYPTSNSSISVKKALETEALIKGVKIINNVNVDSIIKKDKFIINPNKENISADIVVLSTGSMASIGFDSYFLAKNFGHTIIKPKPALVKLNTSLNLKAFEKIRCDVSLSLYKGDELIKKEDGQLQFTDSGISGICVFNLSNYITTNNDIYINFVPFLDNAFKYLENRNTKGRCVSQVLETILNYKVVNGILKISNIKDKLYDNLSSFEKQTLIKNLTSLKIPITETGSFKDAQVCKGGVCLNEINPLNMKSLKVDNLYLTGEMLDVNGDCGGYNLTFAFISGMIAGDDIK